MDVQVYTILIKGEYHSNETREKGLAYSSMNNKWEILHFLNAS